MRVLGRFSAWAIFGLGLEVLGHFGSKSQRRKIATIHKMFELLQVFMNNES